MTKLKLIYLHPLLLGQTRLRLNVCHGSEMFNIKDDMGEHRSSRGIGDTGDINCILFQKLMKIQVSSGRVLADLLFEDHDALALLWRQYRNLFVCQLKHLFQ